MNHTLKFRLLYKLDKRLRLRCEGKSKDINLEILSEINHSIREDISDYERLVNLPEVNDNVFNSVKYTVTVSKELYEDVIIRCEEARVSMTVYMNYIIEKKLNEKVLTFQELIDSL